MRRGTTLDCGRADNPRSFRLLAPMLDGLWPVRIPIPNPVGARAGESPRPVSILILGLILGLIPVLPLLLLVVAVAVAVRWGRGGVGGGVSWTTCGRGWGS